MREGDNYPIGSNDIFARDRPFRNGKSVSTRSLEVLDYTEKKRNPKGRGGKQGERVAKVFWTTVDGPHTKR